MSPASDVWTVEQQAVPVSHLDKVYWPEAGITKGDMLRYYVQIAPVALPYFRDRPVTLRVFPEGVRGASFYQRELPEHAPSWLQRATYRPTSSPTSSPKSGARIDAPRPVARMSPRAIQLPIVNNAASLIWLANTGSIEFHLWSARLPDLTLPDQAIFDLDASAAVPFSAVLEVSLRLREHLEHVGLKSYAKTSGGHGLHVYVPLAVGYTYVRVRDWVKTVAQWLAAAHPERVALAQGSTHRGTHVTIDAAQNSIGRNTAAPYSLRADTTQPRVSTPLSWDEIAAGGFQPADLTPPVVLERVRTHGDLFAPVLSEGQHLPE